MEEISIPSEWQDKFNVKVKFIDEQHRYFFKVLKELENSISSRKCKENVSGIFFSMVHYVDHYLIQEELYFKGLHYPGLQEHHLKHDIFVSGIINLKDEFASGKENVCLNLLKFMKEYFHEHILGYDLNAIEYLKEKGLEGLE